MDIILTVEHTEYRNSVKEKLSGLREKLENGEINQNNLVENLLKAEISAPHFEKQSDFVKTLLLVEELAGINIDLAVHYSAYIALVDTLSKFCSCSVNCADELKKGNRFVCFSYQLDLNGQLKDIINLKNENGQYVLNGTVNSLIYPDLADKVILFAGEEGSNKISAFVVPVEKFDNIQIKRQEGSIVSTTGSVEIADLKLSSAELLGSYDNGYEVLDYVFNELILLTSSAFVGVAQNGYEKSIGYSKEVKSLDKSFLDSQGILWNIADSTVELSGIKLLVLKAGYLRSGNKNFSKEALRARIKTSSAANNILTRANYIRSTAGLENTLNKNISAIYRLEDFFVPAQQAKLLLGNQIFKK